MIASVLRKTGLGPALLRNHEMVFRWSVKAMHKGINTFFLRLIFAACTVLAATGPLNAQQDQPAGPSGEEQTDSSDVKRSMEERLKSLEQQEIALNEILKGLESGEDVELSTLMAAWLPPAVYLLDVPQPLEGIGITGKAHELATVMLEEREKRIQNLMNVKSRIENGEDVTLKELAGPSGMGMESRINALEKCEKDVKKLSDRLEELRLIDRFRKVAKMDASSSRGDEKENGGTSAASSPAGDGTAPDAQNPPADATGKQKNGEVVEAEEGLADQPLKAVSYLALADTWYKSGKYMKAKEAYEAIDVAAHAEGDRVLFMIARCSERVDDLDEAEKAFKEVAKVYKDSFWAKESEFALNVLAWKRSIGPVKGIPPEAYRVLGDEFGQQKEAKSNGRGKESNDS